MTIPTPPTDYVFHQGEALQHLHAAKPTNTREQLAAANAHAALALAAAVHAWHDDWNRPAPVEVVDIDVVVDGAALIATERARQVEGEGWTSDHDDKHATDDLALAAVCYAMPEHVRGDGFVRAWPWAPEYWKPTPEDRVRELVKAGALIAAEIDRLLRASAGGERL